MHPPPPYLTAQRPRSPRIPNPVFIDIPASQPKSLSAFDQWCQTTAWHGVSDFHLETCKCLKISWLVIILFTSFLSVQQCVSLVLDYMSDEDQWITNVRLETPTDGTLKWPDMEVCNLDELYQSHVERFGLSDHPYKLAYLLRPLNDTLSFHDQYQAAESIFVNGTTSENMSQSFQTFFQTIFQNHSFEDLVKLRTPKCNETALHCGSSDAFDLRTRAEGCCDPETARMSCFTIRSEAAFGQSFGVSNGQTVYVLFDPRTYDYYRYIHLYHIPASGLRVKLFYGDRSLAIESEVLLAPGTKTMVALTKQKFRTVQRPATIFAFLRSSVPCNNSYEYKSFDSDKYSSKLCEADCYVQYSMAVCGCNLHYVKSMLKKDVEQCYGTNITGCRATLNNQRAASRRGTTVEELRQYQQCVKQCQPDCEYESIDLRVSNAVFPAPANVPAFTTYLNRAFNSAGLNFTENDTRQLIFFEMYYQMKEVRAIERVTRVTIAELISNIGGTLGVWTGLSMLSVYQCMVYAVKGMFTWKK